MDPLSLAERVAYQDLRNYLVARQWTQFPSRRDYVAIYRSPGGAGVEVQIPLDTTLGDYADAILLAARRIASFELRTSEQVLRDLLQPGRDVVRFALTGAELHAGTVDLVAGLGLLSGAVKSLRASACTVKRPRRFHPRMSLSEADSYVSACRLGQTEIGSFVLTVDTPLTLEQGLDATELPFGRRATTLLFDATAFIAGAIRRGEPSRVLDDEESRVSANLCEALVEMMPADESTDLRLAGTWSALLPPPDTTSVVLIDRGMFEPIEQLAQRLRPKQGTELAQFVGKVIELSGSPNQSDELEGDVVLQLQVDDQLVKVRVPLSAADYRQAGLAHFEQRFVSIMGQLRRGPRVNVLEQPRAFAVLARESAQA